MGNKKQVTLTMVDGQIVVSGDDAQDIKAVLEGVGALLAGAKRGVDEAEKKPDWRIYFNPELSDRGEYVMDDFVSDRGYRISKDAAEALCQFMLREWYSKKSAR